MPKQAGTYKVRGKMDGKSYYQPKNTDTHLFRSINQQMSERVKTEPNYAKTRAYAAEFGVCTELSKSIFNVFNRWYPNSMINKSSAPLSKLLIEDLRNDDIHVLGNRQLMGNTWQDGVVRLLNNNSKSKPASGGITFTGCQIEVPAQRYDYVFNVLLNVFIEPGAFSYLRQIGADSVRLRPFYLLSFGSRYFFDWPGYTESVAYIFRKGAATIGVDEGYDFLSNELEIPSAAIYGVYKPTIMDSSWQLSRPCLYFEPIKHVGASEVVLTQACGYVIGAFDTTYAKPTPSVEFVEYNGTTYYPDVAGPVLNISTRSYLVARLSGVDFSTETISKVTLNGITCSHVIDGTNLVRATLTPPLDGSPLRSLSVYMASGTYSISFT